MFYQNDDTLTKCIISFIKNNNIDDDLKSIQKIQDLIKRNEISVKLKLFDDSKNVFYSLCSIICNKLKICIYILRNEKENYSIIRKCKKKNEITNYNFLSEYIKNYDIRSIPKCYVAMEYFVKSLSLCFKKIKTKDKNLFFTYLSTISSLIELLQSNEIYEIRKSEDTVIAEKFHLVIIKYIKKLFIYVYPFDTFERLGKEDLTQTYELKKKDSHCEFTLCNDEKEYIIFSCMTNVIKKILQNVIKENKKIKVHSLKLLYVILKKIENVYIIKKLFKGISLNLFLLYKSCDIPGLRFFILKTFSFCFGKILMHYTCCHSGFEKGYLKNEWLKARSDETGRGDSDGRGEKDAPNYCSVQDEKCRTYFNSLKRKVNGNVGHYSSATIDEEELLSKEDVTTLEQENNTENASWTARRSDDTNVIVWGNEVEPENFKKDKNKNSTKEEDIEIVDEDKIILSNIYFICYYVLINYDDKDDVKSMSEIFNICKIVIKYYFILSKNLVLMSLIFVLSWMFYQHDKYFSSFMYLLFNEKVIPFVSNNNVSAVAWGGPSEMKGGGSEQVEKRSMKQGWEQHSKQRNKQRVKQHSEDHLLKSESSSSQPSLDKLNKKVRNSFFSNLLFHKDIYSIFVNFTKMLKGRDDNNELNLIRVPDYSLENLNYNIEHYYFKYLYNIFLFKKQEDTILLNFLKGYIYYNFVNSHINQCLIHRHIFALDYLLCLYNTCEFPGIRDETSISFRNDVNILSEDHSLYSLNMYENKADKVRNLVTDPAYRKKKIFSKFQNVKEGFTRNNVRLINEISIFFFLFTDNNTVENYLDEVLFYIWDDIKRGEGKKILKQEGFTLKNKWWEDIYYFTDTNDSDATSDGNKKMQNEQLEAQEEDEAEEEGESDEADAVDIEMFNFRMKYKCLHFLNFYLDALIILLYTHFELMKRGETCTCRCCEHSANGVVSSNGLNEERVFENDLAKNVVNEYSNLFNSYYYLAIKIKIAHMKYDPKKEVEKILLFLTSKKVNKDEITMKKYIKNGNIVNIHYYISLLIICLNKCFCLLYMCSYDDIIEKYFYKNLVFFLLHMSSSSSYVEQLSECTISSVHYNFLKEKRRKKQFNSITPKNSNEENIRNDDAVLFYFDKREKYNSHEIANILNTYNDTITSYIYKKIINIDSIYKCTKLLKITKCLIMFNYNYVYIYKDICLNIMKYTKRNNFYYSSNHTKDQVIIHILNIFNCILYLFYKHINEKRIRLCSESDYTVPIKNYLLQIKKESKQRGGKYQRKMERMKEIATQNISNEDRNASHIDDYDMYLNKNNNIRDVIIFPNDQKCRDENIIISSELFYQFGKKNFSTIVHQNAKEKKKKKLCLYNFLFFEFYRDLFTVDYSEILNNKILKLEEYIKKIKDDMKNIKKEIKNKLNFAKVANIIVDDDFYDLHDEENKKYEKKLDNNNDLNVSGNYLFDNQHFKASNYYRETHYPNIRYTASHIFNFARRFLCHENMYVRFSSHLCILRCLFVFSTRLFELYPKIHQLWDYIKINLSKNDYMNDIILLKIINYVTTIDDKFSVNRILCDVVPQMFMRIKNFEMKNELRRESYEYKFLLNVMSFFLNISRDEKYFEDTHSYILYFCLKCLNRVTEEKIKKISLNIICNLFLSDIPKIKRGIENIKVIKERMNSLYDENTSEKDIIENILLKEQVKDILVAQPLHFLSCLLKMEISKEIIALIINVDYNLINFLIFYFDLLSEKYKYKCSLNQHTLLVFSHFRGF
ncbi:conserved Plasmodium protein, unknown function [Plasmodium malariae]|uniref:VLIG-type G domain-containing protein n=2 Tax=Plasmodium malariae TaxID=5858 RepID=A0A1C3K9X2_PLAMA|nr:conserved Plasmodium protein, unknown function [Plasmodium malariae]